MSSLPTERPVLNFINSADDSEIQIAFGYYKGEPTAALFHKEELVLIPQHILEIALFQGWEDNTCDQCAEELTGLGGEE
tara:strand:+ start:396 stop:632 length:237 start_codon:yes stop_codon:yes gene_type:complete